MQVRLLVLALTLILCSRTTAAEIVGRVVSVADGDTLTLLDTKRTQHKIRLAFIDAPEKGQPHGRRSRQNLSEHAFGKDARAHCYKTDRYERLICTVLVDGKDVGLAQLEAGLAWWYRKYAREQLPRQRVIYESAEDRAAADRIGLWADKDPVPPWRWRRKN